MTNIKAHKMWAFFVLGDKKLTINPITINQFYCFLNLVEAMVLFLSSRTVNTYNPFARWDKFNGI